MPTIRKMTVYVIDYNADYEEREEMISEDIEEAIKDLNLMVHVGEVEESERFIWRPGEDLAIGRRDATDEDFEKYFKK